MPPSRTLSLITRGRGAASSTFRSSLPGHRTKTTAKTTLPKPLVQHGYCEYAPGSKGRTTLELSRIVMAPALPWPFCQRPFTIANFDDHRIRLSVAAPVDLNNIAAFCTEYGWAAKQFIAPELLLTPMHMEELMKERYKDAIKAIMDTCTPGTMTGIVIKIEYKDKIRGVSKFIPRAIDFCSSGCFLHDYDGPIELFMSQGFVFRNTYLRTADAEYHSGNQRRGARLRRPLVSK